MSQTQCPAVRTSDLFSLLTAVPVHQLHTVTFGSGLTSKNSLPIWAFGFEVLTPGHRAPSTEVPTVAPARAASVLVGESARGAAPRTENRAPPGPSARWFFASGTLTGSGAGLAVLATFAMSSRLTKVLSAEGTCRAAGAWAWAWE